MIAPYFCPPLSDITEGWSGAEIEQIVIQSLRKIERYDSIESLQIILQDEILKTTPLSIIRKEDIDKIRNWAVQNGCRMASENKELEEKQQNLNGRRIMV